MRMDDLIKMKDEMVNRGNWKEVERINKMINFNMPKSKRARAKWTL